MEASPRKRGRPRIPVTEEVLEARRLAKQRYNARRSGASASRGPSMAITNPPALLPVRRRGGVSAMESPRRRTYIDKKKADFDVIGMVKNFSNLEPTSNGALKMDVLLADDRNKEMVVSLWEDKALHFQEGLASTKGDAAFVIITGLLAKKYSGTNILLSSGDATKCYFNIDYEAIKDFKAKILASTGQTDATLLPPSQKRFISTEENTVTEATIQELLDAELPPGKKKVNTPGRATPYIRRFSLGEDLSHRNYE